MLTYKYQDGLETERLKTRWLVKEDMMKWKEVLSDKECVEFFPGYTWKNAEERSEFWINKQLDRYNEKRFGLQVLVEKKTGEFIGQCGLLLQEVDGVTELEVGYHIFRKFWGQSFAPEAARLFMNYGFENDQADSIISIIHANNVKSQRVALKNGLKKDKETIWNELPVFIYRIKKTDFQKICAR